MRSLAWAALSALAVLLVTGGLVWAHGLSQSAPPSATPAHGPGWMRGPMTPTTQDPEAMRSMVDACVRAMQDHMSDPRMRDMMGDMMRSVMPGMPMMPMMPMMPGPSR